MPENPNVFTSFLSDTLNADLIKPGDVALLLKSDGSVHALTFGYDKARLRRPANEYSAADRAMVVQGQKLFALSLAAQTPQIMTMLLDIAADPNVVDFDKLATIARPH